MINEYGLISKVKLFVVQRINGDPVANKYMKEEWMSLEEEVEWGEEGLPKRKERCICVCSLLNGKRQVPALHGKLCSIGVCVCMTNSVMRLEKR